MQYDLLFEQCLPRFGVVTRLVAVYLVGFHTLVVYLHFRPSENGHQDIYHALQATLMARLPVWPAIGQALAEGRLDEPSSLLPARASKPHWRGFFGRF